MSSAAPLLTKQFRDLTGKKGLPGVYAELVNDNIFVWQIGIAPTDKDSVYYGGYYKAEIKFPKDYPFMPPSFRFLRPVFHPNIYKDGKLCISILHPPGDDPQSGETAAERWSPAQSVESIILSIMSLLEDPNCASPANVDAGVLWRKDRQEYRNIVQKQVEETKSDIPKDFKMPSAADFVVKKATTPAAELDDEGFWYDSGEEDFEYEEASDVEMTEAECEDEEDDAEVSDADSGTM
ncbi:Ubiquitin-conjugating enzyme subunit [Saitoella coloradoensis]